MDKIKLIINKKPISTQHLYWYNTKTKRYFMKKDWKIRKEETRQIILNQIKNKWKIDKNDIYEVYIKFFWTDKRKHDLDNYNKILLDILIEEKIIYDDNNIFKLILEKYIKQKENKIEIFIKKIKKV